MATMKFEELTEEKKAKLKECKSVEDIMKLAREEGQELSEDDLTAISGGEGWSAPCVYLDQKPY